MRVRFSIGLLCVLLWGTPAIAQAPPPAADAPPLVSLFKHVQSDNWEQVGSHLRYVGQVEIEGNNARFFADQIDIDTQTSRLEANGNVVFVGGGGRIAADRVEFDLQRSTGTFHGASGVLSLGTMVDRAAFGGQDPDVMFYGERIDKLGDRRYRIYRGGFTTCVQPTPRWEVTSGNVTLNLDDYAMATHTVLRVKGVPLMYLPVIYYPIQEDERATGFLLPTYGRSTVQGQSLSNAFFWAIGRSHDATFFHDWFTKTGQGFGTEYRYISGEQSSGNARVYRLDQHEVTDIQDGVEETLPAIVSYQVAANVVQRIGPGLRAGARVDYFTDLTTQQLYQQNAYYSTRSTRTVDLSLIGISGPLSTSVQYLTTERFDSTTSSTREGNTPRVTASIAPRPLFGARLYASVNGEVARLPRAVIQDDVTIRDTSLSRADLTPNVRLPLSRLTFLSVNTTAGYRATRYSRRLDTSTDALVPEPLLRQYFTVRTDVIGPVLAKIWDTPDSRALDRMKHVIEPAFSVDYVTDFENAALVPPNSGNSDVIVGGSTRFTYGLNNRFFYRTRPAANGRPSTREFLTIGLQQTYYTKPLASLSDTSYQNPVQAELSPISLTTRISPSTLIDATTRLEYDVTGRGLLMAMASGSANFGRNSSTLNYSWQRLTPGSPASSYLMTTNTVRFDEGRVAATYSINWDISRGFVASQSGMLNYMAQCCGVQMDFQHNNYGSSAIPFTSNRRFNISFVLAGLGTFSNFFGAFGAR